MLAMLAVLSSSCGKKTVFEQVNLFEDKQWNRFDYQLFEVPAAKDELLDFYLVFGHNNNFPHDRLWVNITIYTPDGASRSLDYHFDLKDEQGNWIGGTKEEKQFIFLIRKGMKILKEGVVKVRIEQLHPDYDLQGVRSVGLVVKHG